MNISILKARGQEIAGKAMALQARQNANPSEDLNLEVKALTAEYAALQADFDSHRAATALAKKLGGSGSALDPAQPVIKGGRLTGAQVSPLGFSAETLKALHQAASTRQSLSVKAFSTVDPLLPAQLAPNVVGKVHEGRLLDHLPALAISAPSYEFIVHSSTTGVPAPTAEGAAKPEIVLNATSSVATAVKIAAHFGLSYETIADFPAFQSYAQTEVIRQVMDIENAQLLSGTGTSGNIPGFFATSGILTHDASADTGTNVTALDSIEMSIAALRTGPALADANLLVLHPNTWAAIRRIKDTMGRFIVNPDPTAGEGNRIWGVPVLVTTAQVAGKGLLLDTDKFGTVLVREGITVMTGTNNDDFTKNIQRFVVEERLTLAVERPSAVLAISNLPVA